MLSNLSKIQLVVIGCAVLVIIGMLAYYLFLVVGGSEKLIFETGSGKITVNVKGQFENDQLTIFSDPTVKFIYSKTDNAFNLIYNEPDQKKLEGMQVQVEQRIIKELGINGEQLCGLPINVSNESPSLPPYILSCVENIEDHAE